MEGELFLPTQLAGAWVNRLTFSPPLSLSSDFQLFVSVRYRKRHGGGMGLWQCMPSCFYNVLDLCCFI